MINLQTEFPKSTKMPGIELMQIKIPDELSEYSLLWDLGEGYISTFCKSKKASQAVLAILNSHKIPAHLMNTDNRIVVIYLNV